MRTRFDTDHLLSRRVPKMRMPFDLSPDAKMLAFGEGRLGREAVEGLGAARGKLPEVANSSRVVVVETGSGQVHYPFGTEGFSWGGQWSPDGRYLAACVWRGERVCLGVWQREGDKVELYDQVEVRTEYAFEVPRWTPDSRHLLVKVASGQKTVDAARSGEEGIAVQSFDPAGPEPPILNRGYLDDERGDLVRVGLEGGQQAVLAQNWCFRCLRIAPDGRQVAVLRMEEAKEGGHTSDLVVMDIESGESRCLATGIRQSYATAFSWSPDSRQLVYQHEGGLWLVAADGSRAERNLAEVLGDPLRWVDRYYNVPPRWSGDGAAVFALGANGIWRFDVSKGGGRRLDCAAIGRNIAFWVQPPEEDILHLVGDSWLLLTVYDPATELEGYAQLHVDSGEVVLLGESQLTSTRTTLWMEAAPDGTGYMVTEGVDQPTEICRIDWGQGIAEPLYSPNPDFAEIAWGQSSLRWWSDWDGRQRRSALVLPPDYKEGEARSLVVVLGDIDEIHSFGFDAYDVGHPQLIAARGHGVLFIDLPLAGRDPTKQFSLQVLPQIQRLIGEGIADPKRIGIYGVSYGAYAALALLTQSPLFAVGVCNAPRANLTNHYDQFDYWGWSEAGQEEMGGNLWERREAFVENSPFFYLDRLQAPLLLVSGSGDGVVSSQAEDIYRALRHQGKRVEWRSYRDEPHFSCDWSRENLRDMCLAVLGWFDRYLLEAV